MKKVLPALLLTAAALVGGTLVSDSSIAAESATPPLRILLVAGGCCHDYETQTQILKDGIEGRIHATVDIAYNPDTSTSATFEIYHSEKWADGFDVVIHDECSAAVNDRAYVNRIIDAHANGTPAVNLHCAMHSYRWGEFKEMVTVGADNARWFEMLGLQSSGHGPKEPIDLTYLDATHPITLGMKPWTTLPEELYNNVQVFPSATPLMSGRQMQKPRVKKGQKADPNAKATEANAIVTWTNEFGPNKTRIFSTTLGHFNETVADDRYLELITRGLLWSARQLNDDGTPAAAYAK